MTWQCRSSVQGAHRISLISQADSQVNHRMVTTNKNGNDKMNVRSLLISFGITTAMSVGALGFAIPALAAPSGTTADCSGIRTCTYVDAGYVNFLGSRTPGTPQENISFANRDRLSSWINYSGTGSRFYYNLGGNGTCVPMYAHDMASASSSNPDNDEAESWAFTRIC